VPTTSVVAGEQPGRHEPLEAAGEDVGCDALLAAGEQLAEVAAVAEHDVAQHEHRPWVAQHFDGGVDGASRSRSVVGAARRQTACKLPLLSQYRRRRFSFRVWLR
jgi:hypothetical protein